MKTALFLLYNTNNIQREHRNLKKNKKNNKQTNQNHKAVWKIDDKVT